MRLDWQGAAAIAPRDLAIVISLELVSKKGRDSRREKAGQRLEKSSL
jgi:hypothetical protein